MFPRTGLGVFGRFIKGQFVEAACGRRYVHKDFHGPEWDLKNHRVVEQYGREREFRLWRRTTERDRWDYYDQVVWRPGYKHPDGAPKEGEIFYVAENVKYQPIKFFQVCKLVQGRTVDDADKQLQFLPRKGALILRQALNEAVKKAIDEHGIEYRSNLWIAECYARKSVVLKGLRRHHREKWGEIEYVFSNLFLRLAEGQPPPYMGRHPPDFDGFYDGGRHISNLRDRRFKYGL